MHQLAPTLETDRLVLRAHRFEDFQPYAELFASERARFMDGPIAPADAWRNFMCDVGQWAVLGYGAWAVELKATGAFIGQVGLNRPYHFPEDELGWLLFDGHEGQGHALEAATRARDFGFHELGLTTLVSYVDPKNARSIALAERLGAVPDPEAMRPENDPCIVFRHPRRGPV
jgi:RimJ/RimL family protein N-acetyltransferase